MHIERLAISPKPTDDCGDNDQLFFCDEISDASFVPRRLVSRMCLDVEFQGRGEGNGC